MYDQNANWEEFLYFYNLKDFIEQYTPNCLETIIDEIESFYYSREKPIVSNQRNVIPRKEGTRSLKSRRTTARKGGGSSSRGSGS